MSLTVYRLLQILVKNRLVQFWQRNSQKFQVDVFMDRTKRHVLSVISLLADVPAVTVTVNPRLQLEMFLLLFQCSNREGQGV